jgi:tRNA nucleotidyltransferase/poly(A) polymerase
VPYQAVVKLTLPATVKTISIDDLEKYVIHDDLKGGSPITLKTQSAKRDGYGIVIRGSEHIIINTDLVTKVEDVTYMLKDAYKRLNEYLASISEDTSFLHQDLDEVDAEKLNTFRQKLNFRRKMTESIVTLDQLPFKADVEQAGGKLYSVGGAVRDTLLGKDSKDLDILITGVPFEQLEQILTKYGRVDSVGKSFGIIKFNHPKTGEIDIAIPRTERPTGAGGYQGFDVTSDHNLPIEKDLERRDFTINAIAKDSSGLIVDPYKGVDDVKNKLIRMVNPQAFSDDPLRMLRAVQFASRFGFDIEPTTYHAIKTNAPRIREISPERILIEFDKIVKKGDARKGAILLNKTGLMQYIFGANGSFVDSEAWGQVKTMGEFIFMLTHSFLQAPAEFYKTKLKGDLDTYQEIKALEIGSKTNAHNPVADRKTVFQMFKTSPKTIESRILPEVIKEQIAYMKQRSMPFSLKDMAINGNDLLSMGYAGKQIGEIFTDVLNKIYREELPNEKEQILSYINASKSNAV